MRVFPSLENKGLFFVDAFNIFQIHLIMSEITQYETKAFQDILPVWRCTHMHTEPHSASGNVSLVLCDCVTLIYHRTKMKEFNSKT